MYSIFSLSPFLFSRSPLSPCFALFLFLSFSFFLFYRALFKRTTCVYVCARALSVIVVVLLSSRKLIQSTCVIPAKFPVSAGEWPRQKWTFLKLVDFTTALAISLISLIEKCIFPWDDRIELKGILEPKVAFVFHQAEHRCCDAYDECLFIRKNNIGMHNSSDPLY